MNIFYVSAAISGFIKLNVEESRHCIKVLRLRKEDRVYLMNGKGSLFEAVITTPDSNGCVVEIINESKLEVPRPYRLSIAIAPTKNIDRFEWFLEKATEIGIDKIIPILCQHSERKEIKAERFEKILISAMKQSGQLFLPELTSLVSFKDFIKLPFPGDKMIAHCAEGEKKTLKNAISPGKETTILIGPEGDFDASEINSAIEAGFCPVSMGESRLRTETAGIVACHTVCLINQKY